MHQHCFKKTWTFAYKAVHDLDFRAESCDGRLLLLRLQWLHLHLHRPFSVRLAGRRAGGRRWCAAGPAGPVLALFRGHPWVEGTDQPVERRVVDHVVHDVVEGIPHSGQLGSAAAQHRVRHVSQPVGLAEVGVHLWGGAAEGERLLLDVVGEALQVRDQGEAGGLELLGEGAGQGQGARLYHLSRVDEQLDTTCFLFPPHSVRHHTASLPLPRDRSAGWDRWTSTPPESSACHSPSGSPRQYSSCHIQSSKKQTFQLFVCKPFE